MELISKEAILKKKQLVKDDYWIYFLIKDNDIVYVGQTVQGMARIKTHQSEGKKDFDSFSYVVCDKEKLDYVESQYILEYEPKYNSQILYSSLDSSIGTQYFSKNKIKNNLKTTGHVINKILKENEIDFKEMNGKKFYDIKQIIPFFREMVEDLEFVYKRYRMKSRAKYYRNCDAELKKREAYFKGDSNE